MTKPINIERLLEDGDVVILWKRLGGCYSAIRGDAMDSLSARTFNALPKVKKYATASDALQALAEKALGDDE